MQSSWVSVLMVNILSKGFNSLSVCVGDGRGQEETSAMAGGTNGRFPCSFGTEF
jgi:hypothetical protein